MSLRHDMSVHLYQAGHRPRAKDVISFVKFSILHAHRPHSAGGCYQTGFMKSGNLNFIESKACPKGPPKGGVWFQVSVKAHDQDAQIYFNGDLVTTIKTHHTLQARAGVFTFHGYQNVVLFGNFQIDPQLYVSKRCARTVEFPGYVKLDADHGSWPKDGFCQVSYLNGCGTGNYQISVDMYNFIGRDGVNFGHLGVFFNAEDGDNYDFVYFRFGIAIFVSENRLN